MKHLFWFLGILIFATSCGTGDRNTAEPVEGKGGVYLGGTFRMNELEDFKSLFPPAISEVVSQRITSQVYEGLVKLNPANLSIVPGIASRWEHNDDLTKWKIGRAHV
mgnify:FL=1